jgi:molybdate-binding protein/DNA-binding transcriptional regulator YhcF (GntR family)
MTSGTRSEPLYERIAADVLRRLALGELRPGERLPTVRRAAETWGVNLNTVARAYALLVERGVLETRAGGGTVVARLPDALSRSVAERVSEARGERLRALLGKTVLEALGAGYTGPEIEAAFAAQLARWRSARAATDAATADDRPRPDTAIRIVGSHDLSLDVLAGRLRSGRASPAPLSVDVVPTGSLEGLFGLAHGACDLAGCHLLDPESGDYNVAFVRRVLPGMSVTLVTLAHREQGLIVAPGNPRGIRGLADLTRPGMTYVNRQRGSGTRVLFEHLLDRAGLRGSALRGYDREELTHLGVAGMVAAGTATAGLGIRAAARTFGLDFVPVARERYELAALDEYLERPEMRAVLATLADSDFKTAIAALGGYDTAETGHTREVR